MSTKIFRKSGNQQMYSDWKTFLNNYGVFESAEDYRAQEKFEFLAEMAHNQAMLDSSANSRLFEAAEAVTPGLFFQRPGSISNMGNPVAPTPAQTPFVNGVKQAYGPGNGVNSGSGDKFPSLLPISIQAAAKTIAFDLVATINMDSPVGFIPYLDYVYMGGDLNSKFPPFLFKSTTLTADTEVEGTPSTFGEAVSVGDTLTVTAGSSEGAEELLEVKFVGYTRVDGSAVFRVIDMSKGITLVDAFAKGNTINVVDGSTSTAIITIEKAGFDVDLTSALENHISGFTTEGAGDWSGNYLPDMKDGIIGLPESMKRAEGEKAQYRQMGLRMFTKFVEAKTDQIGLSATIEEIQDLNKLYNFDVISMLEQIGVNEIAQQISKKITARLYEMGSVHNKEIAKVEGQNLTTLSLVAGGGFENTSTMQRKVVTKLAEMSNLLYHRSRWGAGEYVVTNGRVAAALADINGYSFSPFNSKMPSTGGQLYPAGEVYGMKVYVDPNQKWGDNKILIGRKGKDEEPGIKFMPYIMAETINTISESTMSPKLAIKSRYAITEAGWHPETQYVLLTVDGIGKIVGSEPAVELSK